MASVFAFHPRQCDYPHFVAEDVEYLAGLVGGFIGGEQCDGCGNHSYRVEWRPLTEGARGAHGTYFAVCAVDPSDDVEFAHPEPCGARYRIGRYDEGEVTF